MSNKRTCIPPLSRYQNCRFKLNLKSYISLYDDVKFSSNFSKIIYKYNIKRQENVVIGFQMNESISESIIYNTIRINAKWIFSMKNTLYAIEEIIKKSMNKLKTTNDLDNYYNTLSQINLTTFNQICRVLDTELFKDYVLCCSYGYVLFIGLQEQVTNYMNKMSNILISTTQIFNINTYISQKQRIINISGSKINPVADLGIKPDVQDYLNSITNLKWQYKEDIQKLIIELPFRDIIIHDNIQHIITKINSFCDNKDMTSFVEFRCFQETIEKYCDKLISNKYIYKYYYIDNKLILEVPEYISKTKLDEITSEINYLTSYHSTTLIEFKYISVFINDPYFNDMADEPYLNDIVEEPYHNDIVNEPYFDNIIDEPYIDYTVNDPYAIESDHLVDSKQY